MLVLALKRLNFIEQQTTGLACSPTQSFLCYVSHVWIDWRDTSFSQQCEAQRCQVVKSSFLSYITRLTEMSGLI